MKRDRKIIYIDLDREKRNTAGAKAPDDIAYLCLKKGYTRFEMPNFPVEKSKIGKKVWLLTKYVKWWKKLESAVNEDDVVIYQHPAYGKRVAAKMIMIIKKRKKCNSGPCPEISDYTKQRLFRNLPHRISIPVCERWRRR